MAESKLESRQRAKVVKTLQAAARESRDPRLALLATRAQSGMDPFGNLKKTLKTMVDALNKEKADEMKHKDFCVAGFNENTKETDAATGSKNDFEAKIAELQASIDGLTKDIGALNA